MLQHGAEGHLHGPHPGPNLRRRFDVLVFRERPLCRRLGRQLHGYSETVGFMYYYGGLPKDWGEVDVYRQTATGLVPVLYGTFH